MFVLTLSLPGFLRAQANDRDLLEVTIPRLESLYASHKYTVTKVVEWYLDRIAKYDGIYHAVCAVDRAGRSRPRPARMPKRPGAVETSSAALCGECQWSSRPTPASRA